MFLRVRSYLKGRNLENSNGCATIRSTTIRVDNSSFGFTFPLRVGFESSVKSTSKFPRLT